MTGKEPAVSVIIPTYRAAELLPRALGSLRAQTLDDFEVIVVDDASDDHTLKVAEQWASEDARIRVLPLDRRGGAGRARNRGAAAALGRNLVFHDHDDTSPPERLAVQAAALDAAPPGDDLVYSAMDIIEAGGRIHVPSVRLRDEGATHAEEAFRLRVWRVPLCGSMLRRRLFERVGPFNEALRSFTDLEWMTRAAMVTRFRFVDVLAYEYHRGVGGTSALLEEQLRLCRLLEERHAQALATRPEAAAIHVRARMNSVAALGRRTEMASAFLELAEAGRVRWPDLALLAVGAMGMGAYHRVARARRIVRTGRPRTWPW